MECPFCGEPMQWGLVKSRGYAIVWVPDDSKASWLPPPYDVATRRLRGEAVVVRSLGSKEALRCPGCGAVTVAPKGHAESTAGPGD